MQATVAAFDAGNRTTRVLLDDGTELTVPGAAVDPAVRLLRSGQRVTLTLSGGHVERLAMPPGA